MEVLSAPVLDTTGGPVNTATVTVYDATTSPISLATIYKPDGTALSNPFTSGYARAEGELEFAAANGQYSIKIVNGAETDWIYNVTLMDPAESVKFGTAGTPAGQVHIETADSGITSPSPNADELLIEGSGNVGMSFMTPNTGVGQIYFSDPESNASGYIRYTHSTDVLQFQAGGSARMTIDGVNGRVGVGTASPATEFQIHGNGDSLRLSDSNSTSVDDVSVLMTFYHEADTARAGYVGFSSALHDDLKIANETSAGAVILRAGGSDILSADGSTARIGIGTATPLAKAHIYAGTSGGVTPHADSDNLMIEGTGNTGITLASANTATQRIDFADPESNNVGSVLYNHNSEKMQFKAGGTIHATLDGATGYVGIGTQSPLDMFVISLDSSQRQIFSSWVHEFGPTGGAGITNNAYYSSGWKYRTNGNKAAYINTSSGNLTFNVTDTAGATDAAITWTQAIKIASTGKVALQATTNDHTLDVYKPAGVAGINVRASAGQNQGAYLDSNGSGQCVLSGGAELVSSVWTARSSVATIAELVNGEFNLYCDTGITAGNSFTPTARLSITTAGALIYHTPTVPATAGSTGTAGQIAWDSDYFYVCVATNTWKRAALSTW